MEVVIGLLVAVLGVVGTILGVLVKGFGDIREMLGRHEEGFNRINGELTKIWEELKKKS